MSFALVTSKSKGSSSGNAITTDSFDSNTVVAQLLVAWSSWYTLGADCVITDNAGNNGNFIYGTKQAIAAQVSGQFAYVINPATSASHTVTSTGSGSFMSVYAACFTCGGTCIFDDQAGKTGSLVNSLDTGSKTPAVAASLVLGAIAYFGAANHPDAGSFNSTALDAVDEQLQYVGNGLGGAIGHKLSQTAAINPTWTWAYLSAADPAYVCTSQMIFKPPAGGGGAPLRRNSNLAGLGAGGPFFQDPLSGAPFARRDRIYVPARMAA